MNISHNNINYNIEQNKIKVGLFPAANNNMFHYNIEP